MSTAIVIGSVFLSMMSSACCLHGQAPAAQPQTMRLCTDGCQTLTWAGDHYDGRADGQTEVATLYSIRGWGDGQIKLFGRTVKPVDGIHQAEGTFSGAINPDGTSVVGGVMDWRVGDATGKTPFTLHWGAEQNEALSAATAWLRILDSGDSKAAAAGLADETKAQLQGQTGLQLTVSTDAMLGQTGNDASANYPNYKITRTLLPDSVKQVPSCPCGIAHGTFYAMSYDYKSTWDGKVYDPETRQEKPAGRQGTDVLYMVLEHDATWKPVRMLSIPKS